MGIIHLGRTGCMMIAVGNGMPVPLIRHQARVRENPPVFQLFHGTNQRGAVTVSRCRMAQLRRRGEPMPARLLDRECLPGEPADLLK
jgi:hypothetical protein